MMFKVFAITLRKVVNFSLNAKGLIINLRFVRNSFLLIVLLFVFKTLHAQVEPGVNTPPGILPVKADTSTITINAADSLNIKNDTVKVQKKGDIETTINYSARDSIFSSIDSKIVWLYGDAKVKYGEIELEAEEIIIDYTNNTVTAHGIVDSLGNVKGYPVFKNGPELYETKDIVYNFKTSRARITEVRTKQGEGILNGDAVFKNEKGELLSLRNSYTTCDLEHPHYRIRATKTKAIPNDKIVAGPFYLEFNEIPLPIGFLFGMFPAQRESKSGILFPSYGEQRTRGFNLRNGGYFFDISDYMNLELTGDIYSKGGHALYTRTNYIKRYRYNGSANFSYSKTKVSDLIEDTQASNDFYLTWNHSPQSKGTGRFAASVSAATSSYNKNNNLNTGVTNEFSRAGLSNISTKLNSNISYSKKLANTPFSLGFNVGHNQDLRTKTVDVNLPTVTLNMTNIYPFKSKSGKTGAMDNLSIGYNMAASNRITNNIGRLTPTATRDSIAKFDSDNLPYFFKNAKNGIRHTLPVSFSFKVLKYFTMSPSINYEGKMYFKQLKWYTEKKDSAISQFNTISNYNFGTSLTTRLYGFYNLKRGSVKAIRHIVNPTVSFAYTPDFSKNINYFTPFKRADSTIIYKSRHEGFVYGGSNIGRSGSVGFGLSNNLEMKVKNEKDTVARKVTLLNNLSIGSSYNLLADSFKLAPFSIAANTNFLNNLINFNVSASLDPYEYKNDFDPETKKMQESREKRYAWNAGQGVGRITSAALAMSTNLNPKGREKDKKTRDEVGKSNLPEEQKQYIMANPNAYINFDIPWNLNVSYNLAYSHQANRKKDIIQTVSFSGDLSISEKWKINFNSGYDIKMKDFTNTNIAIARDLHCWTLNLTWVPFGAYQSYNFTIAVKAAVLRDLKMERRKAFQDKDL